MRPIVNIVKKARNPFIARKAIVRGGEGQELHDQQAGGNTWNNFTQMEKQGQVVR